MYDKRNKMENIYLMFSHVFRSAVGGVMASKGYQGDVLFTRICELKNMCIKFSVMYSDFQCKFFSVNIFCCLLFNAALGNSSDFGHAVIIFDTLKCLST